MRDWARRGFLSWLLLFRGGLCLFPGLQTPSQGGALLRPSAPVLPRDPSPQLGIPYHVAFPTQGPQTFHYKLFSVAASEEITSHTLKTLFKNSCPQPSLCLSSPSLPSPTSGTAAGHSCTGLLPNPSVWPHPVLSARELT